jgi:protein ImuB
MLWLCLQVPQLPLEVFSRAQADTSTTPWAVAAGKGNRQTVLVCNETAAAAGIRPGMRAAGAYALAGNLRLHPRDGAAEARALEALAAWAGQFTSNVSLQPPDALLLEIGASLRLFGGLDALLRRIRHRAAGLGYRTGTGVAPTPLAAWVLARAGLHEPVTGTEDLSAVLQSLPLGLLGLGDAATNALQGVGLRSLDDLLRLPRDGVGRRFGPALLDRLDRLLGNRPDPRAMYAPPPRFERRLALPAGTSDCEALLFPARRLLLELGGYLLGRQAGTQQLLWTFGHHRRQATRFTLGLAVPSRDPQHMLGLLRERLAQTVFEHPVEELGLVVDGLSALPPRDLTLEGGAAPSAEAGAHLVERLRARLGADVVQGLQCRPDHRPERAWEAVDPGTPALALPPKARPLWLLPEPQALTLHAGLPWLGSTLALESGPERIESGWWNGGDVARDYYVARNAGHARFWVYRERRGARQWFLHGLFA